MRFPQTLSLVMLATALVPALPAEARRNDAAPRSIGAAFPPACVVSALPLRARQEFPVPRSSPARADVAASLPRHGAVAASLPRHGGVKPPLLHAALKDAATTAVSSAAKSFTQEQVASMVRDGFGDESGASK
ncbi:MAG: hypothetical protein ACLQVG_29320 [Terriglobia bacterium]